MSKYPNLKTIEEKCEQSARIKYASLLKDAVNMHCTMDMFIQVWADSATGMDKESPIAMSVLTEEYTTVCTLTWDKKRNNGHIINAQDKVYGVYFGEREAYLIHNPNQIFFNDLHDRNMKGQREAEKKYLIM